MSADSLLNAAKNNNLQELLASKLDIINIDDYEGWTLLHYAVINENVNMVKALLRNGVDFTRETKDGSTPLHIAASKGCLEIVDLLLKHENDCDIIYYGTVMKKTKLAENTSLHIAASNGFLEVVKSLLRHGACYNIINQGQKTPLNLSKAYAVTNLLNLIEEIFEKGSKGDLEIINKLKNTQDDEFLAIMNTLNCEYKSLIQVVMLNNHHKLTAQLLELKYARSKLKRRRKNTFYWKPVMFLWRYLKIVFSLLFSLSVNKLLDKTPNTSKEITKNQLEHLLGAAKKYLGTAESHIIILGDLSRSDQCNNSKKMSSPFKALKEGSRLLRSAWSFLQLYREYSSGQIEDENIQLINDTLVFLEFDKSRINSWSDLKFWLWFRWGITEWFPSEDRGTAYYNMLNSNLRIFIEIVQRDLNAPTKTFVATLTHKSNNLP